MTEIPAIVMHRGRITIPKEVREHLGINNHDEIMFVIEDDGTVKLAASHYRSIASLVGAAGSLNQPLSWSEMRRIVRGD